MIDINNQSDSQKKQEFDRLYDTLTEKGIKGFKDKESFEIACHRTISICLSVNDYIHSNNVLQLYKTDVPRNRKDWYHYFSLLIYGKRLPRYFLNKPNNLVKKVNRYIRDNSTDKMNTALNNLLIYYAKLYENYQDQFKADLENFVSYFKEHPLNDFPSFVQGIEEIHSFLEGTIDFEDLGFDQIKVQQGTSQHEQPPKEQVVSSESIAYVKDPKVLIIGALDVGKDKVYAIAKKVGFAKKQLEVINDYSRIDKFDISKVRHSDQYCGIIFGPVPHSTTSNNGSASIISHVRDTEGYPYYVEAKANNKLKLTKTSLKQTLEDIYNNYEATKI